MGPRSPDEKDADPSWLEHLATKAHLPAGGPPPRLLLPKRLSQKAAVRSRRDTKDTPNRLCFLPFNFLDFLGAPFQLQTALDSL